MIRTGGNGVCEVWAAAQAIKAKTISGRRNLSGMERSYEYGSRPMRASSLHAAATG
jgi:hypothetical protein